MRLLIGVLLLSVVPPAAGQSGDALAFLDRVTRHYRDAESVHLEATVVSRSQNDFYNSVSRSVLTFYQAPGGRFVYAGKNAFGSGKLVSDGTWEWRLLDSFAEYTKEPAGSYLAVPVIKQGDDSSLLDARNLMFTLTSLASTVRSAHWLPEEPLDSNGKVVKCLVIGFGSEDDTESKRIAGLRYRTKVWIDAATLTILRIERKTDSFAAYGRTTPTHPTRMLVITDTEYTTTEIDFHPKPETFVFVPPEGSTEVAQLPSGFYDGGTPPDPNVALREHDQRFVGKPIPPVRFRAGAGEMVLISRYSGHPLLLKFWATWCSPCVGELSALNRLSASARKTDLKVVAVDEDDSIADATQLLKRRGYDLTDLHFTHDAAERLGVQGIPVAILIDAGGEIVYYHTGAGDSAGLSSALSSLGDAYRGISAQ